MLRLKKEIEKTKSLGANSFIYYYKNEAILAIHDILKHHEYLKSWITEEFAHKITSVDELFLPRTSLVLGMFGIETAQHVQIPEIQCLTVGVEREDEPYLHFMNHLIIKEVEKREKLDKLY